MPINQILRYREMHKEQTHRLGIAGVSRSFFVVVRSGHLAKELPEAPLREAPTSTLQPPGPSRAASCYSYTGVTAAVGIAHPGSKNRSRNNYEITKGDKFGDRKLWEEIKGQRYKYQQQNTRYRRKNLRW